MPRAIDIVRKVAPTWRDTNPFAFTRGTAADSRTTDGILDDVNVFGTPKLGLS
jgi:hypothetical protein